MRYSRRLFFASTLLPSLLSAAPQAPAGPTFTVEATLTRTRSDGQASKESNRVELQANDRTASSRIGGPTTIKLPDGLTMTQMDGNQLDCLLKPNGDGRYLLQITTTHRHALDEAQAARLPQRMSPTPVYQNVVYAGTLIMAAGETVQVSGMDIVNDQAVHVNITLSAQQPIPQQTAAATPAAAKSVTTQFVVTKADAGKNTIAVYSVPGTSGITTSLRIGTEIPMAATFPTAAGRPFVFQIAGSQIDQLVKPANDGRFTIEHTVTVRTVAAGGQFTRLLGTDTLTLRDGEHGHSSLVDANTGATGALEVTVSRN